ncbi:acyl carrier protein phosphodiesterase [uncultured Cytophaga sp.]|uniref:acyl carrier protein phosphodiesterase n=1 Tax=uncultured Cytophaga sp. TaxID=160238 RepID=UPI002629FE71|nr:acyl carrier protein phosphodiesterase [uncultured Cytophaga sp.]
MNFLAHIYLSGSDQQSMIGNFIADSVKGKEILIYSSEIQEGIKFHRFIDTYTDTHPTILEAKKIIAPYFGKYNAVVIDIYMDHFLAKDWNHFSNVPLEAFSQSVYAILDTNKSILPDRLQEILPYMTKQDWLSNYAYFHGMEQVFKGMSRRAAFVSHMEDATEVLKKHYAEFQECFNDFFPSLVEAAGNYKNTH